MAEFWKKIWCNNSWLNRKFIFGNILLVIYNEIRLTFIHKQTLNPPLLLLLASILVFPWIKGNFMGVFWNKISCRSINNLQWNWINHNQSLYNYKPSALLFSLPYPHRQRVTPLAIPYTHRDGGAWWQPFLRRWSWKGCNPLSSWFSISALRISENTRFSNFPGSIRHVPKNEQTLSTVALQSLCLFWFGCFTICMVSQ